MKNLENYGVQELNTTELNEINGGITVDLGDALGLALGVVNIVVDAVQSAAVAVAEYVAGFIGGLDL
ncbi:bacteriocin [Sinomicrobium kalidii]|uniref:bacteriocin n=1 Tax=Sinomicrobium kalidii TaxID=2900738 RepID=UPI001E426D17|nr:bacteriocin [Sinomicrobium kalidii]UGU17762.1 bacteriocin [Sinomicrobium kalidii]